MTKNDALYAYCKGFNCGVTFTVINKKLSEHEDQQIRDEYLRGWQEGRETKRTHTDEAQKRIGAKFEVLRPQDNKG